MKKKIKYIKRKAQAGLYDVPDEMGTQAYPAGFTRDAFGQIISNAYDPNAIVDPGMMFDNNFFIPGMTGDKQANPRGPKRYLNVDIANQNPYVKGFNLLATGVTGIANTIQNNRLKNRERLTVMNSLEPTYFENMDAQGLNNIPTYTKAGGRIKQTGGKIKQSRGLRMVDDTPKEIQDYDNYYTTKNSIRPRFQNIDENDDAALEQYSVAFTNYINGIPFNNQSAVGSPEFLAYMDFSEQQKQLANLKNKKQTGGVGSLPKVKKRKGLQNEIPVNYGFYTGIVDANGKQIDNPTEMDAILNMIQYMNNNQSDQGPSPSNEYHPQFQHYSGNTSELQNIPIAQAGTIVPKHLKTEFNNTKSFFNSYINSKNYDKRLKAQGATDTDVIKNNRKNILNNMRIRLAPTYGVVSPTSTNGSSYDYEDNEVSYDPIQTINLKTTASGVIPHEISHGIGSNTLNSNSNLNLNENELEALKKWKTDKVEYYNENPYEIKADIDNLRYMLWKDGIYDTRQQFFDKKTLDKVKEKYKGNFIFDRLLQGVSETGLLDIMNNVAKTKNTDDIFYAQTGGSISNYLYQKGMDGSYANRKKLFDKYFNGQYSGTAEQNLKMLSVLQNQQKATSSTAKSYKPVSKTVDPKASFYSAFDNIKKNVRTLKPASKLESGVVVDKGTNTAQVFKNGKVVRSFPVLTGKNPNLNSNDYSMEDLEKNPNLRNTPMGNYILQPDADIYGSSGFDLMPINAFGEEAPVAKDLAMHTTYDPKVRNKYYTQAGNKRNQTYGCINCRPDDISNLVNQFPNGDTLRVIDSRRQGVVPTFSAGGGCDDCAKDKKAAGGVPVTKGLKNKKFANVEAEEGEIFEEQTGAIAKIADNAGTHEEGGVPLANVSRVLSDTHDKRKDKASKLLKLTPEEMKSLFNFKPKRSVSPAKAFELAAENYDKQEKKIDNAQKVINGKAFIDKIDAKTAELNFKTMDNLPTDQDVFDAVFMQQEAIKDMHGIKDDGKMKKYGGKLPKAQAGTLRSRININPNLKTPKGNVNALGFQGGVPAYVKAWSALIPEITNVTDAATAQQMTYDYLQKNNPNLIDQSIWGEGLNQKGISTFNAGTDKELNAVVNRAFDPKTFKVNPNYAFTPEDRAVLGRVYNDEYLYNRLVVPEITNNTAPETPTVQTASTPGFNTPKIPVNPNVTIDPKFIQQPENNFYEGTTWADLAPALGGLVDSLGRDPELYNPVEINQLRLKQLDPTAALNANQADYNAALDVIDDMTLGSGSAAANVANLQGQKYTVNNQVMAQYDNQNAQIKNNEITYNTSARDRQSVANVQSRGSYYKNVQLSKEAQRQQRLKSTEDISRIVQMKRRQNNSGNLALKLSPAFNQQGEYNGYQYAPVLPGELGMDGFINPVFEKVPPKKRVSTQTIKFKSPDGRTYTTQEKVS